MKNAARESNGVNKNFKRPNTQNKGIMGTIVSVDASQECINNDQIKRAIYKESDHSSQKIKTLKNLDNVKLQQCPSRTIVHNTFPTPKVVLHWCPRGVGPPKSLTNPINHPFKIKILNI